MEHMQEKNNQGFTIIELVTSLVLISLIVIVTITALYTIANDASKQRARVNLDADTQIAAEIIERDGRIAKIFNRQLPDGYNDYFGSSDTRSGSRVAWNFTGIPSANASQRVLIMGSSSTSTNPLSRSRQNVYIDGVDNIPCWQTSRLTLKPRLTFYSLYFVKNNALYRRIVTDRSTSTCSVTTQYQRQTCPYPIDLTLYSECQAYDEKLVDNVVEFTVDYYNIEGNQDTHTLNTTPLTNVYTSTDDFLEANRAKITIKTQKTGEGGVINAERTVYVSRLN